VITFRRKLLDDSLSRWSHGISIPVLDLGGKKTGKRGAFTPPESLRPGWVYANLDAANLPDCRCTAERLPFKDRSLGSVVMTEVLEYIGDPDGAFREIFRVLREGGQAFISVPLLVPVHFDLEYDRARFTASGLRAMAGKAGFSVVTIEPMGSTLAVIHDLLSITCGYAARNRQSLVNRVFRKVLAATAGIAGALDKRLIHQRLFITSGYFLVLRKQTPPTPS
jgi:SAM-dependent methyltransferase